MKTVISCSYDVKFICIRMRPKTLTMISQSIETEELVGPQQLFPSLFNGPYCLFHN